MLDAAKILLPQYLPARLAGFLMLFINMFADASERKAGILGTHTLKKSHIRPTLGKQAEGRARARIRIRRDALAYLHSTLGTPP